MINIYIETFSKIKVLDCMEFASRFIIELVIEWEIQRDEWKLLTL